MTTSVLNQFFPDPPDEPLLRKASRTSSANSSVGKSSAELSGSSSTCGLCSPDRSRSTRGSTKSKSRWIAGGGDCWFVDTLSNRTGIFFDTPELSASMIVESSAERGGTGEGLLKT